MVLWTLFRALPFWMQIAAPFAIAAALWGTWFGFKTHYYNQGWRAAIEQVAAQDRRAIDAADKARDRVRACADGGGVWNVESGVCIRR